MAGPEAAEVRATKSLRQRRREIATGYETNDGFVVKAGSLARKESTPTIPRSYEQLREKLRANENGGPILVDIAEDPAYWMFREDTPFTSHSAAAAVCLGRSANGLTEWQSIGDLVDTRSAGANSESQPDGPLTNAASVDSDTAHDLELWQGRRLVAKAISLDGRKIRVHKGAWFREREAPSLTKTYRDGRDKLRGDDSLLGKDVDADGWRALLDDVPFSSLSAAASVLLGSQTSGPAAWTKLTGEFPEAIDAATPPLAEVELEPGGFDRDGAWKPSGLAALLLVQLPGEWVPVEGWEKGALSMLSDGGAATLVKSSRQQHQKLMVSRKDELQPDAAELVGLVESKVTSRYHFVAGAATGASIFELTGDFRIRIRAIELILTEDARLADRRSMQNAVVVLHYTYQAEESGPGQPGRLDEALVGQWQDWVFGTDIEDFRGDFKSELESFRGELKRELHNLGVELKPGEDDAESGILEIYPVFTTREVDGSRVNDGSLLWMARLTPGEKSSDERPIRWGGSDTLVGAFVQRSATIVYSDDVTTGYDVMTSSLVVDALSLALLEYATLRDFVRVSRQVARGLRPGSGESTDGARNVASTQDLEVLQRDYIDNSVTYGKLGVVLRHRAKDHFNALRARLGINDLRSDISDEITRLVELVTVRADRDAEAARETAKNAVADAERVAEIAREAASREESRRQSFISLVVALVGLLFGGPAIIELLHELLNWDKAIMAVVAAAVFVLLLGPILWQGVIAPKLRNRKSESERQE